VTGQVRRARDRRTGNREYVEDPGRVVEVEEGVGELKENECPEKKSVRGQRVVAAWTVAGVQTPHQARAQSSQ